MSFRNFFSVFNICADAHQARESFPILSLMCAAGWQHPRFKETVSVKSKFFCNLVTSFVCADVYLPSLCRQHIKTMIILIVNEGKGTLFLGLWPHQFSSELSQISFSLRIQVRSSGLGRNWVSMMSFSWFRYSHPNFRTISVSWRISGVSFILTWTYAFTTSLTHPAQPSNLEITSKAYRREMWRWSTLLRDYDVFPRFVLQKISSHIRPWHLFSNSEFFRWHKFINVAVLVSFLLTLCSSNFLIQRLKFSWSLVIL